jgi:hypothetical protein
MTGGTGTLTAAISIYAGNEIGKSNRHQAITDDSIDIVFGTIVFNKFYACHDGLPLTASIVFWKFSIAEVKSFRFCAPALNPATPQIRKAVYRIQIVNTNWFLSFLRIRDSITGFGAMTPSLLSGNQ